MKPDYAAWVDALDKMVALYLDETATHPKHVSLWDFMGWLADKRRGV